MLVGSPGETDVASARAVVGDDLYCDIRSEARVWEPQRSRLEDQLDGRRDGRGEGSQSG